MPYIHIEVKRVENLNLDRAMEQAKHDAKPGNIPTVFHRKNRTNWKVTIDLNDFMRIYNEYYSSMMLKEKITKG